MNARKIVSISIVGLGLLASSVIAQDGPVPDINPGRHGNLAAAQQLMLQAYNKITAAQKDNRYDMHGHASRAKDLLKQASRELKAAAEEADRGGH
jgi:hypothetical protein